MLDAKPVRKDANSLLMFTHYKPTGGSNLQIAGRGSRVAGCRSLFHKYRKYSKHS